MLMWLYELFRPGELVRHLSLFLLVVAVAMPTMAMLRWFMLGSAVAALVYAATFVHDPVGVFWGVLLLAVVLVRIGLASSYWPGRSLNREEQYFRQQVVPSLGPGQVRRLLSVAHWRDVLPGTDLTRQGEAIEELVFIARGTADIIVDGERVAQCGPGSLIGEVGVSTGDPATANTVTASPVRYLAFPTQPLYHLLDSHADLQDAVELAVQRSLRDKLSRSNAKAAQKGAA